MWLASLTIWTLIHRQSQNIKRHTAHFLTLYHSHKLDNSHCTMAKTLLLVVLALCLVTACQGDDSRTQPPAMQPPVAANTTPPSRTIKLTPTPSKTPSPSHLHQQQMMTKKKNKKKQAVAKADKGNGLSDTSRLETEDATTKKFQVHHDEYHSTIAPTDMPNIHDAAQTIANEQPDATGPFAPSRVHHEAIEPVQEPSIDNHAAPVMRVTDVIRTMHTNSDWETRIQYQVADFKFAVHCHVHRGNKRNAYTVEGPTLWCFQDPGDCTFQEMEKPVDPQAAVALMEPFLSTKEIHGHQHVCVRAEVTADTNVVSREPFVGDTNSEETPPDHVEKPVDVGTAQPAESETIAKEIHQPAMESKEPEFIPEPGRRTQRQRQRQHTIPNSDGTAKEDDKSHVEWTFELLDTYQAYLWAAGVFAVIMCLSSENAGPERRGAARGPARTRKTAQRAPAPRRKDGVQTRSMTRQAREEGRLW